MATPFESCPQIHRHSFDQVAGETLEIEPVAEFWRQNYFPKPWIAG